MCVKTHVFTLLIRRKLQVCTKLNAQIVIIYDYRLFTLQCDQNQCFSRCLNTATFKLLYLSAELEEFIEALASIAVIKQRDLKVAVLKFYFLRCLSHWSL